MRFAALIAVIALSAVFSVSVADALTLVTPDGPERLEPWQLEPWQTWADQTYPRIDGDALLYLNSTRCGGAGACAGPPEPAGPARIYMGPTIFETRRRFVFRHELGHVFDYLEMNDQSRAEFQRIMGDYRPWRSIPEVPTVENTSPHEQFADAYQFCAYNPRKKSRGRIFGGYFNPTPRQYRRVCVLIARVGR